MDRRVHRRTFWLFLAGCLMASAAQSAGKPVPFERMQFFVGSWTGTGEGQPGRSTVERSYSLALDGRFIEVHNRSVYAPQEKNPKGEVHEDRGFIGWDRALHRFVFRQFHTEGFVNHYVADTLGVQADSVVFTSVAIENIPAGYRARETYRIIDTNTFIERFEIAEPNGPFEVYSQATFKRKR